MNGEYVGGGRADSLDDDDDIETEDTIVMADDDDDSDDVGDTSIALSIENLVAKLESTDEDDICRRRQIRKRLEELREQREAEAEIDSTFNFNLDDDL